jgi:SAM-dependent methyltransferase
MRLGTYYRYRLLSRLGVFDGIRPTDDVLDVGGFDGFVLSRLVCGTRTLVDPDARSLFPGINYLPADFLSHDFAGQRFDVVFSFDVVEHLPAGTEARMFARIGELLKPGGQAFVTTPSRDIRVFPAFLRGWVAEKWDHHKCPGFTREELRGFVCGSGLEPEFVELNAPAYLTWYLFVRAAQPLLPARLQQSVLGALAAYDAAHHPGEHGYFLLRLRRAA